MAAREASEHDSTPVRLGVSACLLGQEVRYDGGHKRDKFLTGTLARFVERVPWGGQRDGPDRCCGVVV
jgi:hypothetical protein